MNKLTVLFATLSCYAATASNDTIRGVLKNDANSHGHGKRRLEEKPVTGECTVEKFSTAVGGQDALAEILGLVAADSDADAIQTVLTAKCEEALKPTKDFSVAVGMGPQFLKNFLDGGTTWNDHYEYTTSDGVTKYSLGIDAAIIKSEYEAHTKTTVYGAPDGGAEEEYPGYFSNFHNDGEECRMGVIQCCYTGNRIKDFVGNADMCAHDMTLSAKSNHISAKSYTIFDTDSTNEEKESYCTGFAWEEDSFADAVKYNTLFHMAMKENLFDNGYVRNIPGAPLCGCAEQMPIIDNAGCVKAKEGYKIDTNTGKVSVDISWEDCNALTDYYSSLTGRGDTEKFFLKAKIVESGKCGDAADNFMNDRMLIHA